MTVYFNVSDYYFDACKEEFEAMGYEVADDGTFTDTSSSQSVGNPFITVTECTDWSKLLHNVRNGIVLVIFLALRIWFALNIRDWRDRFYTKKAKQQEKAKKKAEEAERMAGMGLQMVNVQANGMQVVHIQPV